MSEDAPINPLLVYHNRTSHRFEAFAQGPGYLDWDTQPAAFRHYLGATVRELALTGDRFERRFGQLGIAPKNPIKPNLASLSALLELALGVSAWKSLGPNRWALRCNPSSGNLHPVEAYVLSAGLPGISDGLHHYDPKNHQLEGRALRPADGTRWLAIGLSSAMWREAWKYGERSFRYCQLDVGHAIGTLTYAAALLGWRIRPLPISGGDLRHLLGLDRSENPSSTHPAYTEVEEPEVLLGIEAPECCGIPANLTDWLIHATWQGAPSQIDPAPSYSWPIVGEAAMASSANSQPWAEFIYPDYPPLPEHPTPTGAAQLIRQRRSAQRFDPKGKLNKDKFYRILDATLPRQHSIFSALVMPPSIHLILFVQRIDGLPPGLYLLPRTPEAANTLPGDLGTTDTRFSKRCHVANVDPDCPAHLNLTLLAALELPEVQRLARALSCHQDIASTSAFSLGMLGDFEHIGNSSDAYRQLLREAGLVGQILYLEAEAAGVRGTGIGCFFDEPVRQTFGITTPRWQSVYHFTIGTPIVDTRIETSPPYAQKG